MVNPLQEEKVFKDPVHKYIYVQDQTIWDLINTREFQRLRRVRQLGTCFLTFHGAEHSRFSHSLGVYEVTRKIISQFERNQYEDWPRHERLLCLCAALLHDVGHGPFSHSIEKTFGTHHEAWSCRIVLGETEVNQVLRQVAPDFPQKVADVIAKTYNKEIVVSLVSSQLDADRMDYLLRDAYYTGVNYGTFDLERILRVMRPYQGHIVVKESGMHAVEDYLMSRYQMYWQVYFHPVTRSAEIVLHKIFQRAKQLYEEKYRFRFLLPPLLGLFEQKLTVQDYHLLDEAFMQTVFMQWTYEEDEVLSDLCSRFLERRLFKYVTLDRIDTGLLDKLRGEMKRIGIDPAYYVEIDFPSDLSYDIYRPGEEDEKLPILLLDSKDSLTEISRKSEIVRSISGIHMGKYHLYYPGEFVLNHGAELGPDLRRLLQL
ncbi:HD domain-containing protein [Paenibacillus mucilaginosus]|uniref:YwfO n=2 Tax=Paenibacillus mucilaginosus TaxID=61624 RepID=H6NSI3_9BACL|nr:HD domain-containing protein [Paenibacillus mucilaginosus]AEI46107.1 YwfO [Paenibacillus mucilaginosus KNP414]AFC33733.1 YwfO [Paenibacillus mucilaginosus 3016]MCG7217934.1 HD domain-containing protein [Paenibacillus mucilaginosus]WDM27443.1 HD domain-containing protein [Paenibacillus mucilaginosus]WFA22129.1 HD domain-containing protein [Paenibacillus mucilaginosus]